MRLNHREHVLDQELGFPVSVGGTEARIFPDRNRLRFTVHSSRRRKDKTPWAMGKNRLEQGQG